MERLQNLKCLDTHFWAVELIVWVVFLVLFNTVSDRQSAVVHVVYCFYDVCRTYYQRSDRIFKRFYHWPDTHEDRESQTVDPGYIIFCCTSCIYGVQPARANISISRRCLWSTDLEDMRPDTAVWVLSSVSLDFCFRSLQALFVRKIQTCLMPRQRCFMNLQSDLPHRWKHR